MKENGEKELLLIFNMNMDAHSIGILKVWQMYKKITKKKKTIRAKKKIDKSH